MMMNTFTNKLPLCFPSILLKDSVSSIGSFVTSVPYRKYAFLSTKGIIKDEVSIPYMEAANRFVNDA